MKQTDVKPAHRFDQWDLRHQRKEMPAQSQLLISVIQITKEEQEPPETIFTQAFESAPIKETADGVDLTDKPPLLR